ncbi:MAG: acetate--CoA ligase family protein [Chloroflexota bacterium]
MLDEMTSREFLAARGIRFNETVVVRSAEEVDAAVSDIGLPVAMKIVSPDIVHKSDAGCVIVGIDSEASARAAFDSIMGRALEETSPDRIHGVSVQEMVTGIGEAFVGGRWTPEFGPIVMVGLGGVMVELFGDVSMRLCPVDEGEVSRMLEELESIELLRGFRGRPVGDVEAFLQLAVTVSEIMAAGEVDELDLNPVMVLPEGSGVVAVDARVALREAALSAPDGAGSR